MHYILFLNVLENWNHLIINFVCILPNSKQTARKNQDYKEACLSIQVKYSELLKRMLILVFSFLMPSFWRNDMLWRKPFLYLIVFFVQEVFLASVSLCFKSMRIQWKLMDLFKLTINLFHVPYCIFQTASNGKRIFCF